MNTFDEIFFKDVFHTYYDKIFLGFYKRTNSYEIAQDLTQLTFIKFWNYRDSHDFNLSVEIQLFRKAKLIFIDWLRKQANERELMKTIKESGKINFEEIQIDLKNSLTHAVDQLPPMRKKVFLLSYFEGFSHKEIADKLNISIRTVDGHVLKALQQLRKILALIFILQNIN